MRYEETGTRKPRFWLSNTQQLALPSLAFAQASPALAECAAQVERVGLPLDRPQPAAAAVSAHDLEVVGEGDELP